MTLFQTDLSDRRAPPGAPRAGLRGLRGPRPRARRTLIAASPFAPAGGGARGCGCGAGGGLRARGLEHPGSRGHRVHLRPPGEAQRMDPRGGHIRADPRRELRPGARQGARDDLGREEGDRPARAGGRRLGARQPCPAQPDAVVAARPGRARRLRRRRPPSRTTRTRRGCSSATCSRSASSSARPTRTQSGKPPRSNPRSLPTRGKTGVRILISGICGFAGSSIARALAAQGQGHEISGLDNFMRPGSERNRADLKRLGDPRRPRRRPRRERRRRPAPLRLGDRRGGEPERPGRRRRALQLAPAGRAQPRGHGEPPRVLQAPPRRLHPAEHEPGLQHRPPGGAQRARGGRRLPPRRGQPARGHRRRWASPRPSPPRPPSPSTGPPSSRARPSPSSTATRSACRSSSTGAAILAGAGPVRAPRPGDLRLLDQQPPAPAPAQVHRLRRQGPPGARLPPPERPRAAPPRAVRGPEGRRCATAS